MVKSLTEHFTKEITVMVNKHMRSFTLFIIKEIKIKTIKQQLKLREYSKIRTHMEQEKASYTAGGSVYWYSHFGNLFR